MVVGQRAYRSDLPRKMAGSRCRRVDSPYPATVPICFEVPVRYQFQCRYLQFEPCSAPGLDTEFRHPLSEPPGRRSGRPRVRGEEFPGCAQPRWPEPWFGRQSMPCPPFAGASVSRAGRGELARDQIVDLHSGRRSSYRRSSRDVAMAGSTFQSTNRRVLALRRRYRLAFVRPARVGEGAQTADREAGPWEVSDMQTSR
jgi:hypothetical protein